MPKRKPEIVKILSKNKEILIGFISEYESNSKEEDFEELLGILQEKLQSLGDN